MNNYTDDIFRAKINASLANRSNPAVAADTAHAPERLTAEQEAEFVAKTYGAEEERLQKLIDEANRRPR